MLGASFLLTVNPVNGYYDYVVNRFIMAVKPKGGRGLKAPYESAHVRVPLPIKAQVEQLVERYRESVMTGTVSVDQSGLCDYEQAVEHAHEILKQKKSARQSVAKLLTAIYGRETTL